MSDERTALQPSATAPEEAKRSGLVVGKVVVRLMNEQYFKPLRNALGYESWMAGALQTFDWSKMASGGGKGGDKMARSACKRLFVKEVSGGDLATLTNTDFLKASSSWRQEDEPRPVSDGFSARRPTWRACPPATRS